MEPILVFQMGNKEKTFPPELLRRPIPNTNKPTKAIPDRIFPYKSGEVAKGEIVSFDWKEFGTGWIKSTKMPPKMTPKIT